MSNHADILISLESRHADNIFNGSKQVEFRRRTMRVESGDVIWVYVKLPIGSIVGNVRIESVEKMKPIAMWRRFGPVSGLSKHEFFEYFHGVTEGVALVLSNPVLLSEPISLKDIRKISRDFQPPQFFSRLQNGKISVLEEIKSRTLVAMANSNTVEAA